MISCYGYTEELLKKTVTDPFNEDKSFWILGKKMRPSQVKEIYIFGSERKDLKNITLPNGKILNDEHDFEYVTNVLAAGKVPDVIGNATHTFVNPVEKENHALTQFELKSHKDKIFIVHGTDHEPVKELKTILEEVGLTPIILHEQAGGSRTIVEKLERYSEVDFAFVILTPDDLGISTNEIPTEKAFMTIKIATGKDQNKPPSFLKSRARQNVVLEFGYFIGKLGRDRVCCLYKGNIELPSDLHGICYVHFQNSISEVKQTVLTELEAAGYQLKKA